MYFVKYILYLLRIIVTLFLWKIPKLVICEKLFSLINSNKIIRLPIMNKRIFVLTKSIILKLVAKIKARNKSKI